MGNAIVMLRGWALLSRVRSRVGYPTAVRPLEKVSTVAQSAARRPPAPMLVEILDRDDAPINQGWFWAMMKTFGG